MSSVRSHYFHPIPWFRVSYWIKSKYVNV